MEGRFYGGGISGFTIVRNARKLDYPFRESVLSILPLCDEFIINCGDSTDDTREICAELEKEYPGRVRVFDSIWERKNQSGGYQLKAQTDSALAECSGKWCFYIQADEAVHEADWENIRAAMQEADQRDDIDGLVFDYLHFYGNYSYFIKGRNWYRREVRLIKNGRGIESYRDAQGFRRAGKRLVALPSHARVFHYGYVRSSQSLQKKSEEMSQWWGETPNTDPGALKPRRHVGLRLFREAHPGVMRARVSQNSRYWNPMECPRKWDANEIKNAITLVWESIVPYRIGEFRNYELAK